MRYLKLLASTQFIQRYTEEICDPNEQEDIRKRYSSFIRGEGLSSDPEFTGKRRLLYFFFNAKSFNIFPEYVFFVIYHLNMVTQQFAKPILKNTTKDIRGTDQVSLLYHGVRPKGADIQFMSIGKCEKPDQEEIDVRLDQNVIQKAKISKI